MENKCYFEVEVILRYDGVNDIELIMEWGVCIEYDLCCVLNCLFFVFGFMKGIECILFEYLKLDCEDDFVFLYVFGRF